MRNSFLHLVLSVVTLVLGGGLEEILPKMAGVGFPVLLAAVIVLASRLHPLAVALFALSAGGMEDSLSSLPIFTSASFFCLVGVLQARFGLPRAAVLFVFPVYQLWLRVWLSPLAGSIFLRLLLAIPIGCLTHAAMRLILSWVWERASLDEQD